MYLRKLPSGKWQCTVRHPSGKKITATDPLKSVVRSWGQEQEAAFARGDLRDPRAGQVRVTDWRDVVLRSRKVESATAAKTESLWRTHCRDKWGTWPLASITRADAQKWANDLCETRRARDKGKKVADGDDVPTLSPETVTAAVHLMSGLFRVALQESPPIVATNPFDGLKLPRIVPNTIVFFEPAEAEALYDAAEELGGTELRTMIELGCVVGLRVNELLGLRGSRVDFLRGRIEVVEVMTRHGVKAYPKTRKSHRIVPVPSHLIEQMSTLMVGRERDDFVFVAPGGGPWDDSNFRCRAWLPAVKKAGVPKYSPRVMRHTAASWLVQDGVPLEHVQALLGHESYATTMRYAHLRPDAHDKVVASWARRAAGASPAHGNKTAGSSG